MRRRNPLVMATASSMSKARAPRPIQSGRYGVRNGTNASRYPMGTKPSATVVTMWMPIRARQNNERFRCTAWETNRGHRCAVQPTEEMMPRITVPERSTSETSPVARVKYHSAVPWDTNTDAIMGCSSPVRTTRRHPRANSRPARSGHQESPTAPGDRTRRAIRWRPRL